MLVSASKEATRGIFTEAVVMGMNSPSHYNSIDLDKHKNTSPKYDWNKSKIVRIPQLKKTPAGQPEVSPSSYNVE